MPSGPALCHYGCDPYPYSLTPERTLLWPGFAWLGVHRLRAASSHAAYNIASFSAVVESAWRTLLPPFSGRPPLAPQTVTFTAGRHPMFRVRLPGLRGQRSTTNQGSIEKIGRHHVRRPPVVHKPWGVDDTGLIREKRGAVRNRPVQGLLCAANRAGILQTNFRIVTPAGWVLAVPMRA